MPQLRRIKLHIGEQSVKVFLRIVADSGFHQSVDCFLQELNVEGTVLNHLDHLAEQILRFDDVAEVTQSFFYDGSLVFFVIPSILVADIIVFEKINHVLLGLVGEVVIEDHAQDIVLELVCLHVTSQGICHRP